VAQVGAGRRLTLVLTRTPEAVSDQERGAPPRLVLDLDGPRPAEPRQVTAFPLSDELVSRVRVGSFGGKLRAIVDLSRAPGAHAIRSEGAKVIVDLGDTSRAAAAPARAADAYRRLLARAFGRHLRHAAVLAWAVRSRALAEAGLAAAGADPAVFQTLVEAGLGQARITPRLLAALPGGLVRARLSRS
jgi:hypothetical protein